MVPLQTALLVLALTGASEGDTVLLDFYADWCGPCQQMDPVVRQLAAKGYPVRRVNFDQQRQLASRYGVDRLPTFLMLVNGRVVDRVVGATSPGRLEKMCLMAQAHSPASKAAAVAAVTSGPAPSVVIPAVNSEPAFSAGQPPVVPTSMTSTESAAPGWRLSVPTPEPSHQRSLSDSELIAATVRLRIQDTSGQSCGSGTIIDARKGEALILTCGHIFRDSKGQGQIEVDLFGPSSAEGVPGNLLSYDLKRDVALLSIRVPGPVVSVPVAPAGYKISRNDRVINVGCNNGANPTVRHSSVTALDKFMGPANLTVAGLPVQGRSGGGLFSTDGYVVGVCNAADPSDNEGLYAALESIYAELDQAKLAFLYRPEAKGPSNEESLVAVKTPNMPKQMPEPQKEIQLTEASLQPRKQSPAAQAAEPAEELTQEERDALAEIRRHRAEGAEVICVVRSADPNARSEIIVLERATDSFLKQLALETQRLSTAAANPSPLTPPVFHSPAPPATMPSVDPVPVSRRESTAERTRLIEWAAQGQ